MCFITYHKRKQDRDFVEFNHAQEQQNRSVTSSCSNPLARADHHHRTQATYFLCVTISSALNENHIIHLFTCWTFLWHRIVHCAALVLSAVSDTDVSMCMCLYLCFEYAIFFKIVCIPFDFS